MYTPAANEKIADKIISGSIEFLTSAAFCLEDTIPDNALDEAENTLAFNLGKIADSQAPMEKLPKMFVRVRNPEHLRRVHKKLGSAAEILTGYILPKFDSSNAESFLEEIQKLDTYCMPILETREIADISTRTNALAKLKNLLDNASDNVLNVRVGGNDFCNLYGLRRGRDQTIYDIGTVRDILTDILNVFLSEYVVSGAVWEYYGSDKNRAWADGLQRELALDRLNGFIGKTAIHPSQLPLIFESMKASREDFEDAGRILSWDNSLGVAGSGRSRMNEVKVHRKWAERVLLFGEIYGIREEADE